MIRDARHFSIALKAVDLYPSLPRTVMDVYCRMGREGAIKAMRNEFPDFTVHLTPQGASPFASITGRGVLIDAELLNWDTLLELIIVRELGTTLDKWLQ